MHPWTDHVLFSIAVRNNIENYQLLSTRIRGKSIARNSSTAEPLETLNNLHIKGFILCRNSVYRRQMASQKLSPTAMFERPCLGYYCRRMGRYIWRHLLTAGGQTIAFINLSVWSDFMSQLIASPCSWNVLRELTFIQRRLLTQAIEKRTLFLEIRIDCLECYHSLFEAHLFSFLMLFNLWTLLIALMDCLGIKVSNN